MKKVYGILAAALMSASVFAAPADVPAVADLAASYDVVNNIVLALYFDEQVCNDVVLAGSYKSNEDGSWITNPDDLLHFEQLAGFDGWYVVEFNDEGSRQAKPVQLKSDGTFDWDYQSGDVAAWINHGENEATIEAGFSGEANVTWPVNGAYIYEVAYFKNSNTPCGEDKSQTYTLILKAPYCEDNDGAFVPEVMGGFNNWETPIEMSETIYKGDIAFTATIKVEPGKEFKFRGPDGNNGWNNEILKSVDGENWEKAIPDNYIFPEDETELVYDFSNIEDATEETPIFKYALCGVEPEEPCDETVNEVVITVTVPAGAPAEIELVGSWGEATWNEGAILTLVSGNTFTATIEATECAEIKVREKGTWDNQIINAETGNALDNIKLRDSEGWDAEAHTLTIDLSEGNTWTTPAGIETVVLDATVGVRKVVVDGVIYIQKGDQLFNVLGAQVR